MSLKVIRPGMLSTVQDLGRYGMQHLGIVPCGAMDEVSHRIANALVGNKEAAATVEMTLRGPELEFKHDALIALHGAQFAARVNGHPMPRARPVAVRAGARLDCGRATLGCRAYLAIAGGFIAPESLGSRSTYLPAGFGGLDGHALRSGDRLELDVDAENISAQRTARLRSRGQARNVGGVSAMTSVTWRAPDVTLPAEGEIRLHALEGRHADLFENASVEAFFGELWRVLPDSNRMGFRLGGPTLVRKEPGELLSEPTCLGTVQVPADGAPIVLMADHQTTGGYAKIAEVAGADVPRLAQAAPGSTLRFGRIDLSIADALRGVQEHHLAALRRSLAWQYA
jgi:antagonist of KipI